MEFSFENMDAIDGHLVEVSFLDGMYFEKAHAYIPDQFESEEEDLYIDFHVPHSRMIRSATFEEIEWFKVLD